MATPAKRSTTTRRTKARGPGLPENHTESEAVAFAIASQYADLKPSINRIMEAELTEGQRLEAINLFRASLGVPGDVNRNPMVAIENGRLAEAG